MGKIGENYYPEAGDKISIDLYRGKIAVWIDPKRSESIPFDISPDFPLVEVLTDASTNLAYCFDVLYERSGEVLRELNDLSKEQCKYIDLAGVDVEVLRELGLSELDMHFLSRTGRLSFKPLRFDLTVDEDRVVCVETGKQKIPLKDVYDICEGIDDAMSRKKGYSPKV